MANLIDPNEIMFTKFEPQTANRFIMYVEGIPAFMIKKVKRPTIEFGEVKLDHINVARKLKGKGTWADLTMTMYNPIVPSGTQAVMQWIRTSHESVTGRDGYADFYKKDFTINVLGPVGDKVEEWRVIGAFIKTCDMGEFDWANDQHMEITCTISYDYAELVY